MAIPSEVVEKFQAALRLFLEDHKHLALLEVVEKGTNKTKHIIVVTFPQENGKVDMYPLAEMLDDNAIDNYFSPDFSVVGDSTNG